METAGNALLRICLTGRARLKTSEDHPSIVVSKFLESWCVEV